jgi:hypothetical protein
MADPIVPTPQDAQLLLQDTTTKTASFNTPSVDLGAGFSPGGLGKPLVAVAHVTAVDVADGNESYTFVLQESSDNVTFVAAGAGVSVTTSGAHALRGWLTRRYARLALTVGGTTPSVTFKAWLNPLP